MEDPHAAHFQRVRAADEPVRIGAFHLDIEQLGQALVVAAVKVIVMHDRDAQAVCGGFKDQLPRIVMIHRRGLQAGQADGLFPSHKTVGQFGVDQEGLLGQFGFVGIGADLFDQRGRAEGVDPVVIKPHRMKKRIGLLGQHDRCIQRIADPLIKVRAGVEIDVQPRVHLAQFGQPREQPLAAKQGQHAQVQAQDLAVFDLTFDRSGQFIKFGADRVVERLAIVGHPHRLVLTGEQAFADEFFQRSDPAA